MVKHIVTFKFKGSDEVRKEIARKFADALMALPAQIAELKSIEVGINENPKESWDLVLGDWSSDVCSSDLRRGNIFRTPRTRGCSADYCPLQGGSGVR